MKSFAIVTTLTAGSFILAGCMGTSCSDYPGVSAAVSGITATVGAYSAVNSPAGNLPTGTTAASVDRSYATKDIAITVSGTGEYPDQTQSFAINFSLFPRANACALPPSPLESDIKTIRVFIATSDNPSVQTGIEITDDMEVAASWKQATDYTPLNDWNSNSNYGFSSYYSYNFVAANLAFSDPTAIADGRYGYELMITLDNGELFTATTNEIMLVQ